VVTKFMGLADYVLLGGQMGDVFSRLAYDGDVSHMALSAETVREAEDLISNFKDYRAKLFVPVDVVGVEAGTSAASAAFVPVQNLTAKMVSEDIGPATRLWYGEVLALCRTIIWNGPMGAYEVPAFARGTALVTRAMSECQGVTLAGGVDTSAAILKMSDRSQVSFISTGGSAFLKALAGQSLAALEALLNKN